MCAESEGKRAWNRTWWGHQDIGKTEEEKHTKEAGLVWPKVRGLYGARVTQKSQGCFLFLFFFLLFQEKAVNDVKYYKKDKKDNEWNVQSHNTHL